MKKKKILYLVHCIDTEGPLTETLEATFKRLYSIFGIKLEATAANLNLIQNKKMDLSGQEDAVANCFSSDLLNYNENWNQIDSMLDEMLSKEYRLKLTDDFGGGWVYSWHCMDHAGYKDNPRHKDLGYGNVFNHYRSKLTSLKCDKDEINWHFHPLSFTRIPTQAASSYLNSYDVLLQILCRRIIDESWFPIVNRPGFHTERPDSHAFLEQWIPFDYANQISDDDLDQPDLSNGRYGDWSRASKSWRGYNPSHDDYQQEGNCRRRIFRCLNLGSRSNPLTENNVREAFEEASETGEAILSFNNHDYRDMRPDVDFVRKMLSDIKVEFPDVAIKFSGAEEAATLLMGYEKKKLPKLDINIIGNSLIVDLLEGDLFGPQPFLAIKTNEGLYYHDNFDVIEPQKKWSYIFDEQTLLLKNIKTIGVASAGLFGKRSVVLKNID